MIGVSAMNQRSRYEWAAVAELIGVPEADQTRQVNEEIAIIEGLTELLIDGRTTMDEKVILVALESVRRHTAVLKNLIKGH